MYWVYIIKSRKTGDLYIGRTNNLVRRLEEHNSDTSISTARYKPWTFIYIEGYASPEDAEKREQNLKYFGKVYTQLKRRIKNSLRSA